MIEFSTVHSKPRQEVMLQVIYKRTVVGWYNVYKAGTSHRINLSPQEFKKLLPDVSDKARYGTDVITATQAIEIGLI
jgi:hypothetical protein